ncbi:MAG: SPOR domain-containing protein, partial [Gemmatimonadetes bacterium]|nr:SPOR domain-containing protein [Gemmatimonadota bacterium]
MRTFAVLVPLILLNACALPAVYSIATLAVDGISYATSGKGLSDHAISAVA